MKPIMKLYAISRIRCRVSCTGHLASKGTDTVQNIIEIMETERTIGYFQVSRRAPESV
jgi:hypothetical protein